MKIWAQYIPKKFRLFLVSIFAIVFIFATFGFAAGSNQSKDNYSDLLIQPKTFPKTKAELHHLIMGVWNGTAPDGRDGLKNSFEKNLTANMNASNPWILYDTELATYPLIRYASIIKDWHLLSQIADVYNKAVSGLSSDPKKYGGLKTWLCRFSENDPTQACRVPRYDGRENLLSSAQFVFGVTAILEAGSRVSINKWEPPLRELGKNYWNVVLQDHVLAWILGPKAKLMDRTLERLNKPNRDCSALKLAAYCNAVTDGDMFVASSALNLLALNMRLPQYFGMSGSQKKVLTDYVIAMGKLTRTHLSVSSFLDPRGIKKNGLNFDVGNWDNDPQFQFASDTVMKFPGACWVEGKLKGEKAERDPLPKAKGVGWDISHARRFVHYFETLLNLQSLVGQKFLTKDDLKGLTDQAFLGTLRIRSKKPYFTNFMSGHMGWFRVCYEDRPNFGLAPLCTEDTPVKPGELKPFGCLDAPAFAESAYGFWLPYSPNYSSIMKGIWARYESVNPKVIKNIKALPSFYYAIDGK